MMEMCSAEDSQEPLRRKAFIGRWKAPQGLVARARIIGLLQSREDRYRSYHEIKDAAAPLQLGRQETILAAPMDLEGCAPGPMPTPIPLEDEASRLETPPRLSADDQPTVEAPAGYRERVLQMDALAAQDTAGEEMAKLQRRMLRLERVLYAILPSLLLIPGLPEKRRTTLARAIQLLRKALEWEWPRKKEASGAPGTQGWQTDEGAAHECRGAVDAKE